MPRKILIICLLFFSIDGFSQTYSYSFKGTTSAEDLGKVNNEILQLKTVLQSDFRYKSEKQMGEFIFSVDPMTERGENDHPFSPVDVKAIIVKYGLEPSSFTQIK
jgi:hypothetical protein